MCLKISYTELCQVCTLLYCLSSKRLSVVKVNLNLCLVGIFGESLFNWVQRLVCGL